MIVTSTYAPLGDPWGARLASCVDGDGAPVAVDLLNRPLPGLDPGAPQRAPLTGVRMAGVYTLTWDVSSLELPEEGSGQGFYVRCHVYVVGSLRGLRVFTVDPCPQDSSVDRLWFARVARPPLVTVDGLGGAHTLTVGEVVTVAAIRGEVRCFSEAGERFEFTPGIDVVPWREERHGYEFIE